LRAAAIATRGVNSIGPRILMQSILGAFPYSPIDECPQCHSAEVRRSRRRSFESLFVFVFRLRPYRCTKCGIRYLAPASMKHVSRANWDDIELRPGSSTEAAAGPLDRQYDTSRPRDL